MATLTIELPDELARRFDSLAKDHGVTPEQVIRQALETYVDSQEARLDQVLDEVLKRNAELYRRLA